MQLLLDCAAVECLTVKLKWFQWCNKSLTSEILMQLYPMEDGSISELELKEQSRSNRGVL